jgi:hypothetical protein
MYASPRLVLALVGIWLLAGQPSGLATSPVAVVAAEQPDLNSYIVLRGSRREDTYDRGVQSVPRATNEEWVRFVHSSGYRSPDLFNFRSLHVQIDPIGCADANLCACVSVHCLNITCLLPLLTAASLPLLRRCDVNNYKNQQRQADITTQK